MSTILKSDIRYLKGIGEQKAKAFRKLGIETIEDLISYYPRGYEDWKNTVPISDAVIGDTVAIAGTVISTVMPIKTRSGKLMHRTCVTDGKGMIIITFFNNPFVAKALKVDEEYIFYGKIRENEMGGKEMISPAYEISGNNSYLHPIYRCTATLNSKAIAKAVKTALDLFSDSIAECLPVSHLLKYKLLGIKDALMKIHFPQSNEDINSAKRRLIYEELLILQLGILSHGKQSEQRTNLVIKKDFSDEFIKSLPFELTNAQKRAINECMRDMKMYSPMKRLLQGDVGSGKTAVAAVLMANTVKNGFQCVLMAPTEVLARQHYNTFLKFFEGTDIKISLLTGAVTAKNKKQIKNDLAQGSIDILIGTHACLTEDTVLKKCALVITDEQHRFGVSQRAALRSKGENPHVLVMSATPIPRTLSLIIYGDLDISILDEKPKGRLEIETYSVKSHLHERIYAFIKKQVSAGRQCYVVCPNVEENDEKISERKSAEEYCKFLSETVFSDLSVGLLHGKMKQKQKEEIMTKFKNGEIDVLVCTVVIEVGIDVPNANTIVIENAECFGLSALHQLRGRVGRGAEKSYCILVSDSKNDTSCERFNILCSTSDGFKIAEEDLKLRGPGDFFGYRQSGLPLLKIASLMTDSRILYSARQQAEEILKTDPVLEKEENALLKEKISFLFADIS